MNLFVEDKSCKDCRHYASDKSKQCTARNKKQLPNQVACFMIDYSKAELAEMGERIIMLKRYPGR